MERLTGSIFIRLCSAMTSAWFAFVEAASFERRALNFSSLLRGALVADAETVSFELPLMVGLLVVMALVTKLRQIINFGSVNTLSTRE